MAGSAGGVPVATNVIRLPPVLSALVTLDADELLTQLVLIATKGEFIAPPPLPLGLLLMLLVLTLVAGRWLTIVSRAITDVCEIVVLVSWELTIAAKFGSLTAAGRMSGRISAEDSVILFLYRTTATYN